MIEPLTSEENSLIFGRGSCVCLVIIRPSCCCGNCWLNSGGEKAETVEYNVPDSHACLIKCSKIGSVDGKPSVTIGYKYDGVAYDF